MTTENGNPNFSLEEFLQIKSELADKLTSRLEMEVAMNEFNDEDLGDSDILDTPTVDSKSVIKLSPLVEEVTGRKIKPEWIKPGGYETVDDAVSSLIQQLELDFNKGEGGDHE